MGKWDFKRFELQVEFRKDLLYCIRFQFYIMYYSVNQIWTKQCLQVCCIDSKFFSVNHDDVIQWKHFPHYWPFVWGIHWSPAQRPVMWSFDVFFDLCLNKRLSKHSWGWWFEMLLCPLWRHCIVITVMIEVSQLLPVSNVMTCHSLLLSSWLVV